MFDREGIESREAPPGLSADSVVRYLAGSGLWIRVDDPIGDGHISWRPDLGSSDGQQVLHVHLAEELRPYIQRRLKMAVAIGKRVVVVAPLESL